MPATPSPHDAPKSPPATVGTNAPDKLPFSRLIGFAAGGLPYNLGLDALKNLANPIYNIVLGVNPALIGTVMMLARLWDAFADPFMGMISDNTRTRWGRRRPYIAAGAMLSGIAFPLVWFVPRGASPEFALIYFGVAAFVFYTMFTLYSVPYVTLAMELTPDYSERTRIVAARTYFSSISGLLLSWAFSISQWSGFGDVMTGIRAVGIGIGALFFFVGLVPAIFSRERYLHLAQSQPRQPFVASFKIVAKNQPFRVLVWLTMLLVLGTYTFQALGIYVTTYYVYGGDMKKAAIISGLGGTILLATNWVLTPFITIYARKRGKIRALKFCLWCGATAGLAKWFLFDPAWPYAQLLLPVILSPAGSGFWLLVNSMKADVCDLDELESGVRREGAYAAISAWIQKFSAALTYSLSGFLLVAIGFQQSLGGAQPASTIWWLRVAFSVAPTLAFAGCLLLVRHYKLTPERMAEIRTQLESRRAAV